MTDIARGLENVRAKIAEACAASGRSPNSVKLVAVSKLHPSSAIQIAHGLGQRDFGENYPQELRDKARDLSTLADLSWHAIGPVQTNKAKYIAKAAHWFHALDRLELAQELSAKRDATAPVLRCFLQVNVSAEASKHGVSADDAEHLLSQVRGLPRLEVVGLMTLPPLEGDPRLYFEKLRTLAGRLQLPELSMGTTHDYASAIAEGATWVRIGTAIFGERPT
jgi:pyridoxal phosphate enzyme (YggS family)